MRTPGCLALAVQNMRDPDVSAGEILITIARTLPPSALQRSGSSAEPHDAVMLSPDRGVLVVSAKSRASFRSLVPC